MPTILLTTYELRAGILPPLCAKCGEPTDQSIRLTAPGPMAHVTLATLLIFCPPLFVVLALILKRRSSVDLPMCRAHGEDWRRRDWLTSITYLPVVCGSFVAAGITALFAAIHPVVPAVGYYFVWAAWVAPAAVLWARTVRITKVTRWGVRLSGVDPTFVTAIREDRARDANPARLPWHGDPRDDYDDQPE